MAVEAVLRQCFVVVCALFRVRPATASRGRATNQRQPEQMIWGQMQGTFFLPSAIQSPAILALTGLRGNVPMQEERKRRVEKRWKYIWSALVILFLAAEMDTRGCMEAWQHCKMNPAHSSARVPVPTLGEGGDRQPKEGEEGAKRLDGQRDPGGCAGLCRMSTGTGLAGWPLHRQARGASWSFSKPHFQLRAPHALPSLPFHGEITSPRPALSSGLPGLPLFSLLSSSRLSASTLAPAAHDQRHLVHFGNFTFFFI